MNKLFYLLFSLFLFLQSITAATFGGPGIDHGYDIIRTSDNGVIVLGQIENQSLDIYLIKLDSMMNVQWIKTLGDSSAYDYPYHICQMNDGGFLIAGGNLTTLKAYVLRLDAMGDIIWSRNYGTDPNALYYSTYVEQYSANQITIGLVEAPFTAVSSLVLMRMDTSGNIIDTLMSAYGGERVLPVTNGYLVTGNVNDLTPNAITLDRLDTVSGHSFTKSYFDSGLNKELWSFSSAVSGTGFLTAGWTNLYTLNNTEYEFYLLQTDDNGDSLWSKHWGIANTHCELNEIISSGNYFYATGYSEISSNRENLILKLNAMGDTMWTKSFGKSIAPYSLYEYSSGYFISTGDSIDTLTGKSDIWIMMFDSLGNLINNISTSIATGKSDLSVGMFPTIAKDFIQLTANDYSGISFTAIIVDSSGKIIKQMEINSKTTAIDIRNFKPGSYFLRMTDKQGRLAVKKFIVQ